MKPNNSNDSSEDERAPQLQLGATSSEAENYFELTRPQFPNQGDIANKLTSQQWNISRAGEPDANISRDYFRTSTGAS